MPLKKYDAVLISTGIISTLKTTNIKIDAFISTNTQFPARISVSTEIKEKPSTTNLRNVLFRVFII